MEGMFEEKFERALWDRTYLKQKLTNEPDDIFNRYRLVFTDPGVTWPMNETFNHRNNIPTTGIVAWAKTHITAI
jgi:hypothetical protein